MSIHDLFRQFYFTVANLVPRTFPLKNGKSPGKRKKSPGKRKKPWGRGCTVAVFLQRSRISRSVCSIKNGAFIITERTATLESMIIFVTLLNVSLLILIERSKLSRFHVFLSGFNCQLHSFDSIVTDDVRAFIIPSRLQRSISRNS